MRRSKPFIAHLRAGLVALVLAVSASLTPCTALASIVNEPMTGIAAPGWVIGGAAFLTASTGVDFPGAGWLRITDLGNNEAGYAFLDTPFDISQGVIIQFDYATWGGTGSGSTCGTTGADGYSVYLFDGTYGPSTFSPGATGGSLGYAQKVGTGVTDHAGLTGGYIGVGIDEWGNFSNPSEGRLGGPGMVCDGVAVRGPYNHPSGAYYYLGGATAAVGQLAFPSPQNVRPDQSGTSYRKVMIKLTPVAAPNYLRVDTYIQFGAGNSVTTIVTNPTPMYTMRAVPASVKIGYAASTGGSNNYHEIRNLTIDPLVTDSNVSIFKLASAPSVTVGGQLKYTITVRNDPTSSMTATAMQIADTMPSVLSGVTWTCTASGAGASCNAPTSGSGNINTTVTLPISTSATFTVTATVNGTATPGSIITNIASLTTPTGFSDYNPSDNTGSSAVSVDGATAITISGTVYSDANFNGVKDGGEAGTNGGGTVYAKLFRSSNMASALTYTTVASNGTYTFTNVPSYDTYTIILSTNTTLSDYSPSFPANWIYTSPVNYTIANLATTNANVTGQNFGVYNGSRITGKVINDNGLNGAPSNANDGILNAAETGIPGVTVGLSSTNNCAGTLVSALTGSGGDFMLYTNTASATLYLCETNPANYLSVNGKGGSAYNVAGDYITLAYTLYTNYSGFIFGDVQKNTFLPTPLALSNNAGTSVYYAHTFTPNSGGLVSFSTSTRSQTGWPALSYYLDANCNGAYDAGLDSALSGTYTANAGVPICILVKDTIPAGALLGTQDAIVTMATFSYTGSALASNATYTVSDTTTVGPPGASVSISGTVYNDANHDGSLDNGETSPNVAGVYAKLFSLSNLATALSVTTVNQATGAYAFNLVTPNAGYVIILSSTNTTAFDPSFPNAQWVATSPTNFTLSNVAVGGSNLSGQNFGVYNGTRIDGMVLQDDGAAIAANANNGVQNTGEVGIAGMTMSVCDNSSCTSLDTHVTDSTGAYTLFVPWTTNFAAARVTQVTSPPAGYSMVNYSAGTATGGAVNLAGRYITFTFTRGTSVTGLVHSEVPGASFVPTPLGQDGAPNTTVYYAHTYAPGSGGTVRFSTVSRSQGGWPALQYYLDVNCDGVYTAGTDLSLSLASSLTATANTPICILVADPVASGAAAGQTDVIVTRATFTYTNSYGPVTETDDVQDTTTVVTGVGNKPLYLYSAPTYTLSRTKPASGGAAVQITRGASQTWTEAPGLALPDTISNTLSPSVPVQLYLSSDATGRTFTVSLFCSSAPTTSITAAGTTTATALTWYTLYLPFTGTVPSITCSPPNTWKLQFAHTGAVSGTRYINVDPDDGTTFSNAALPSQNVINVDLVSAYTNTWPSTSTPAAGYYTGGAALYARAIVSDPFGAYDIVSPPTIVIRDASGAVVVNNATMSAVVSATTSSNKTYEYPYTVPVTGPTGTWTMTVTAQEGTEGLVSRTGTGQFRVVLKPSLSMTKQVAVISDPTCTSGGCQPHAIPGGVLQYTIVATNTGYGSADANSVTISDAISTNLAVCVTPACNSSGMNGTGTYFLCSNGCGLTFNTVTYTCSNPPTPCPYVPNSDGWATNVTSLSTTMNGTFSGASGPPYPQFSVIFNVQVK